ncbi:Bile acid:sodium symporter [Alkaliphilus metalliredigens QYMF]|uniref:Bile acid:sodium symporter n=1 Tax=Alkaliphilus metalliredigens (strain QYMF) TaxID=293826 RepID=A6TPD2_ALKMQ|nr:bile acid:sodium symporter [Alkaliphilus metalliredigens]ABR48050.1 Bile acid:sodium symporter [Alkaliphilus metalliredigens QYMF]
MSFIDKLQSVIILGAVLLGLLLGQVSLVGSNAEHFILPFLTLMLFGVFLQIPLKHIGESFKNIKFTGSTVIMNFVWTPIFAWALGSIFLREIPAIWLGFIMLMVTPCTDWYLIFIGIAKGNVALGAAALPLKLLLQLLLLPFYLLVLGGSLVDINAGALLTGVTLVLMIPFILALIVRQGVIRRKGEAWFQDRLLPSLSFTQIIFLSLAIVAMFASQGEILMNNPAILLKLLLPTLIFYIVNFVIGQVIGRLLKLSYEDTVAFNFTTLARNSPVALAIAVASFPDEPLIALALVIGPLIELPILAVISQLLLIIGKPNKLKNCQN